MDGVSPGLGVTARKGPVTRPDDLDQAFSNAIAQGADAMIVLTHGFAVLNAERIMALGARHKMPVLYGWHDFVVQGGLMSYGPDIELLVRRAAGYVDRMLRGEKPANLPVEQPARLLLSINIIRRSRSASRSLRRCFFAPIASSSRTPALLGFEALGCENSLDGRRGKVGYELGRRSLLLGAGNCSGSVVGEALNLLRQTTGQVDTGRENFVARQPDADTHITGSHRGKHRLAVRVEAGLRLQVGGHAQFLDKGCHGSTAHATFGGIAVAHGLRGKQRTLEAINRGQLRPSRR